MTARQKIPRDRCLVSVLALTVAMVGAAVPVEAARPPVGRTYYTVAMGLEEAYGVSTECLEFHQDRVCSLGGLICGSWRATEGVGREMGLAFDLTTVARGELTRLEGHARLDTHGRKSSFAAAGRAAPVDGPAPGVNFAFAGREVAKAACLDLLAASPGDDGGAVVVGSGNILTEEREVGAFHGLVASGVGLVEVRHGEVESLRVTADDNILPLITSQVRDGQLVLSSAGRFRTESNIRFEITVPELDAMTLAGVLGVEATGIDTDLFTVGLSGVTSVTVSGRTERQVVSVSGVSRYDARDLASRTAEVDVTGPSRATVRVSDVLRGSAVGGATLEYIGNPVVDVAVDFTSTLRHLD